MSILPGSHIGFCTLYEMKYSKNRVDRKKTAFIVISLQLLVLHNISAADGICWKQISLGICDGYTRGARKFDLWKETFLK